MTYELCRERNTRRRVDAISDALRGTKRIDLSVSSRVIQGVPIEVTTKIFGKLIWEGGFGRIGISEVLDPLIVRQAHLVSLRKCTAFSTRVDALYIAGQDAPYDCC